MVMVNRMKQGSSKASSLGDSIKRHIFSKGLLPRTPKRSHPSVETPTVSNALSSIPFVRVINLSSSPPPHFRQATPNRAQYKMTNPGSGLTPNKRVLFQTPLKMEPASNAAAGLQPPATPTSGANRLHVVINKSNCASADCLMEETSLKAEGGAVSKSPKSSSAQGRGEQQRRLLPRKYPSEPNLKSCFFAINDESDGGGGGSGVEAIASAGTGGYNAAGIAGKVGVSLWDLVTIARATEGYDSSREKISSLNGTEQSLLLVDDERPSPITKSTRRMPKYMQVRWLCGFNQIRLK